ncbi:hypothetical protein BTVI_37655 [Pitangus sulphuratus]|nr:hypothetical protein BTVI_37655 [Pitangus sulphuratus]
MMRETRECPGDDAGIPGISPSIGDLVPPGGRTLERHRIPGKRPVPPFQRLWDADFVTKGRLPSSCTPQEQHTGSLGLH